MIVNLDAWLLERVAQPVADWLAEWVSPLQVARWLLVLSLTIHTSYTLAARMPGGPVEHPFRTVSVLVDVWIGWWLWCTIRRAQTHAAAGRLNALRSRLLYWRVAELVFVSLSLLLPPPGPFASAECLFAVGLYLGSCEDRPPIRHAWSGAS